MMTRLDERLTQAKTRLRRRQKLESMHGDAFRILLDEQAKLSHYRSRLEV